jgi:hypothetical protein
MGVIGHQPERNWFTIGNFEDARYFLETASDLAEELGIEIKDVIATFHMYELRRANHIAVEDGNYRDEHIAGLCNAIDHLAEVWDNANS